MKNVIVINDTREFALKGVEMKDGWIWFTGTGTGGVAVGDRVRVFGPDGVQVHQFTIPEVKSEKLRDTDNVTIRLPVRLRFEEWE